MPLVLGKRGRALSRLAPKGQGSPEDQEVGGPLLGAVEGHLSAPQLPTCEWGR